MKLYAPIVLIAGLAVAGCTSAPTQAPDVAAPATSAPVTEVTAAAPPAADTTTSTAESTAVPAADAPLPGATAKVSANNATAEELTAAFEAAGISNAAKWTREVMEYRPYPADDPNFTGLREELAKYNPAPGVVDQIVSVLEP